MNGAPITLYSAADVGEMMKMSEDKVLELTRIYDWPCLRFNARTIRYRADQIERIVARYERGGEQDGLASVAYTGQTARSRAYRRSS